MTPHELLAKHFIPLMRALVAHELRRLGLGQERIARLLGVSQPLISKYLRTSIEDVKAKLSEMNVNPAEAISIASMLASRLMQNSYIDYLNTMTAYANSLLARGVLCSFHRRVNRSIPPTCDICMKLFSTGFDPYIKDVEEATRIFTSNPLAVKLVPNVGTNIVSAKPEAESTTEVVGLTGGIVRVGERAEAVGLPAYGGSRHTASILLIVKRRWRMKRAAIVIAYSEECVNILKRNGLNVVIVGPHSSGKLFSDIVQAVNSAKEPIDAIASVGGLHLEPVIYVFAGSAVEAVKIALLCAEGKDSVYSRA